MVVKDHNGGLLVEELLAFRVVGLIGIHHHDNGLRSDQLHGIPDGDEHATVVVRIIPEAVDHLTDGLRWVIHDDMGRPADGGGAAPDADGSAQGVHIGDLMTHDEDILLAKHDFLKGMGLDTGLDAGVLLGGLGLASEVPGVVAFFDHHLVSAASKGDIDGRPGCL